MDKDLKTMFQELSYNDKWCDAELPATVRYVRGSTRLAIPEEWRELLPYSF